MGTQNNRGQVLIELIFTLILFTSLLSTVHHISQKQIEISNKNKISKKKDGTK